MCMACTHVYLFVFDTQTDYRVGDNHRKRCLHHAKSNIRLIAAVRKPSEIFICLPTG